MLDIYYPMGPIGELESDSIQKTSARWRASLGAT
jgi:hypothetical protein